MIKIGKYNVVQSGSILLGENIPLSIACDGVLLEIMYKESNESSLSINGDSKKKLLVRTIWGQNTYSPSPCLFQKKNGKEYYFSFILSSTFEGGRNLTFNLLRN